MKGPRNLPSLLLALGLVLAISTPAQAYWYIATDVSSN